MSYEYSAQIDTKKIIEDFSGLLKKIEDKSEFLIMNSDQNKISLKFKDKNKTNNIQDIDIFLTSSNILLAVYNATRDERDAFIQVIRNILLDFGIIATFEEE